MNCHRGYGVSLACFGHTKRGARCAVGNCRRHHDRMCDFPVVGGHACGAKLCESHTVRQPDGRDYCPYHQRRAAEGRGE